jgi:protein tyrosine/serine phosphatase
LVAGAIGGGIWIWKELLEDRLIPKRFGVVTEGLVYRSGQLHPALVERVLREHEIDLIIDLDPDETQAARAESEAAEQLGIRCQLFPLIGDGTGDAEQYVLAIRGLVEASRAGERVLVHCAAGSSRTGGVLAMYRVLVEGWSTSRAKQEMMEFDWRPGDGRLLRFLNANMGVVAERLVECGVIARVPEPLPRFPEPR